jgi:histidinol-phosphate aminotransferase
MTAAPRYKWQPTTQEIAERFGLLPSDVVRFDHNTSPYSSDWAAGIVAPLARTLNEYPGASYAPLRGAAAAYLGLAPDNVVAGAGIDELILLIAKAFLGPGTRSVAAEPTYPLYQIATIQHGGEFIGVPYTAELAFAYEDVRRVAETSDVVWLCVPNNPTGDRIENAVIQGIIAKSKGIVVIDAAYAEFSGDSWAPWIERHDNLLVLNTTSKAFGLAGVRVGFATGHPDLVASLDSVRPPGSIASMSAGIAESALREPQRMRRAVRRIADDRNRMAVALEGIGITVAPSTTNFLLCSIGPGARDLAASILREGLIVRTFPQQHMLTNHLRFTVRSPDENARLVDTLWRHLSDHAH